MDEKPLFQPRISPLNLFSQFEIKELKQMLWEDEEILGLITGLYGSGIATLGVTSKRLLLVDKKWIRLSYEDIRFDKINEVKFSQQIMLASMHLLYAGQDLYFRTWYMKDLRSVAEYVQRKMFVESEADNVTDAPQPQVSTFEQNITQAKKGVLSSDGQTWERWRRATQFIFQLPQIEG